MADLALRRCRPWLGTFVEIAAPAGMEAEVEAAFAAIARIHRSMSFHEETSDLARLRRAPAGSLVEVDVETVTVLRIAAMLHQRSGGLFDVAIGARLVATGFLPRPSGIALRTMVGTAGDIEIVDDSHVRCHRPLLIDLGGIAKGHAVDRAAAILAAAGAEQAIVNAGGDLCVVGETGQIIDLRDADGGMEGSVEIADAALASSSNRHLRRRHHGSEVAPHLGRDHGAVLAEQAVTVIAGRCIIADAMTKVALADHRLAAEMLAELGGEIVALPSRRLAA
jgi:thiamine biosynthesis lipoprotein